MHPIVSGPAVKNVPILHRFCTNFAQATGMPAARDPRLDGPMAGPVKTEAVVLRSMRYGEADRILHVYTPHRGRISAIAKGVRRTRSRFGGPPGAVLPPASRAARGARRAVDGHRGGDTVDAHPRLRENGAGARLYAARACDAVGRLFETPEPHPAVYNLLCSQLALLDVVGTVSARHPPPPLFFFFFFFFGDDLPVAFRMKLLVPAGLAPALGACATCGERRAPRGLLGGRRGGRVQRVRGGRPSVGGGSAPRS